MKCCSINRDNVMNSNENVANISRESSKTDVSMIHIPQGSYSIGDNSDIGFDTDNEFLQQEVHLDSFKIDITSVTNLQFSKFVEETGYITDAELIGSSFVFKSLLENHNYRDVPGLDWWKDVEGANWKHPFGDIRSYEELLNHPVVHVSVRDALSYCKWVGKRLPHEIEWEVAARGGKSGSLYPWGNELELDGFHRCNVWQGNFPSESTLADGYLGTAPVDAFYTNDYEIQQMIGNVWELCSNKARIDREEIQVESIDEQIEIYQQGSIDYYAAKGGSFLCHESYCNRYRLKARNGVDRLTSASNIGFRCVQE